MVYTYIQEVRETTIKEDKMKRLNFKDIKKGDKFKANRSGLIWIVSKRSTKRKKITAWTRDDIGCVEIEYSVAEMNRAFVKVED